MRYKITDNFETHGIWSLNSDFETSLPGKLIYNYSDGAIELEFSDSEFEHGQEFDVIYGLVSRNRYISLLNVRVSHTSGSIVQYTKLYAEKMIIDAKKWSSHDANAVSKVYFSFEGLGKFLHFNNWRPNGNNDFIETKESLKEYKINILNATLKEKNFYGHKSTVFTTSEYKLYNDPYFEIEFYQEVDLDHAYQIIFKIRQLLTFFVGESLPLKNIEFLSTTTDVLNNKMPFTGSYYLHQVVGNRNINMKWAPYKHKKVMNHFENVLNNYFENYDKIKPIMQNHLGDLVMDNYIETFFLNACTNIEIFHREIVRLDKEVNPKLLEYYSEITEITINYPDEIQSDIKRIISDAKKVNLNQRLRNLIDEVPDTLINKVLIQNYQDKMSNFTYYASNTRNHITHGSTRNDERTFKLDQLSEITLILEIILEYHLMSYLGLPNDIIINGIRDNKRYQRVMVNPYEFQPLN